MPLTTAAPDALARVYATALFDLAKVGQTPNQHGHDAHNQHAHAPNRPEEILGELEEILELARQDRKFGEFLSSRILPSSSRERSLKAMFQGKLSDLTLKFLLIVNRKDRLGHLPAIVSAFAQMVQQAFGRVEVDVYTASPIDQSELSAIRQSLQNVLKREPVVHTYTQPSMIGGLKLQIGDQLIDASLQTRLRTMGDRLKSSGQAGVRSQAERFIAE